MKKIFLSIFLSALALCMQAELVVRVVPMRQAELVSLASKVGCMVVQGEQMVVYGTDGAVISRVKIDSKLRVEINEGNGNINVDDDHVITSIQTAEGRKLRVYPNPTTDILYLDGCEAGENVLLYSIGGQLVEQSAARAADGVAQFSMGALPAGEYVLVMKSGMLKVMKQ